MGLDRGRLPHYPLARIIAYLYNSGKGTDLIPYADEILARESPSQKDVALFFKSKVLAESDMDPEITAPQANRPADR